MAADSICASGEEHDEAQKPNDGEGDIPAPESTACSMEPVEEGGEEDIEEELGDGAPEWPATEEEFAYDDLEARAAIHAQLFFSNSSRAEGDRGREEERQAGEEEELQAADEAEDAEDEYEGEGVDDEDEPEGEKAYAQEEAEYEEEEGLWEEEEEEEEFDEEGSWEEGEEEEQQLEDNVEEEEAVESVEPEKAVSKEAEQAKNVWDAKWAGAQLPDSSSSSSRQWMGRRRAGNAPVQEATQPLEKPTPSVPTREKGAPVNQISAVAAGKGRGKGGKAQESQSAGQTPEAVAGKGRGKGVMAEKQTLRRPAEQPSDGSKSKGRGHNVPGSALQPRDIGTLEAENRQLKLELGQAMYKVQQLSKLREQASECQRRELLARQKEARALKELDIAKEYVGKRDSFARNEKAELLQQVKSLEDTLASITGREDGLREELAEATMYRQQAAQEVEGTNKELEKWKHEAIEHAKQARINEQRLKQLEEKRQQDKSRLRELAAVIRGQPQAPQEENQNENADNTSGYDLKSSSPAPKNGSGKRVASKPPLQKGNKKGGEVAEGQIVFEDPIKPVANMDVLLSDDSTFLSRVSCAGLRNQLGTIWQRSLRPLLLRSDATGGCSGSPGRGKGKKAGRDSKSGAKSGGASAKVKEADLGIGLAEEDDGSRQRQIIGALVVLIVGLAVSKLITA